MTDVPTMDDASVARAPDSAAIKYFDGVLTMAGLDARSDSLALALAGRGFAAGDRLAVYVQNNPAFVIALLAAWKAGGAAVVINPMNKGRELKYLLTDSGAGALLCLDDLYESVAKEVIATGETAVGTVITCSPLDGQSRNDERLFAGVQRLRPEGTLDLEEIFRQHDGSKPALVDPGSDDLAVLCYTSGTTGVPKGAMCTHGNMVFNSQTYRDWMGFTAEDSLFLGVAPLFHITGLIGHMGVALLTACPLVINHRFEAGVVIDAIREHKPTFTVGSITVFINLSGLAGVAREDWSSFRMLYSGGAPIAPAITDQFMAKTGLYIHNIYGLTETNSPSHAVPLGKKAPVDPNTGALSVGVPVFDTVVRILDEAGKEVPVAVREAAVVGVPDQYRGETVKA